MDKRAHLFRYICMIGVFVCAGMAMHAQQILLDQPVKAGELTLFPSMENGNTYYYISDKPQLAEDENGHKQFSFLRYVENEVGTGKEGNGGGIVHAVVSLKVSDAQLDEARRELRSLKPGAEIAGPVVYTSGKFGIVSAFANTEGELSRQVVGMGQAPVLDGQKAAISIELTQQGAKILWESFQTATPDISFTFEMEVQGYRSPHQAVIEANFEQIYDHKAFNLAMASQYLSGEIKSAYDDLFKSGAIQLTQVGEDEQLDKLINTAYNKIADMMFHPVGGTGTPSIAQMGGGMGQKSLLDKATQMLANNRKAALAHNQQVRDEERLLQNRMQESEWAGEIEDGELLASTADYIPLHLRKQGVIPAKRRRTPPPPQPSIKGEEIDVPDFAIMGVFEMKKVRQRGIFKIDLNKFTTDHISMRFDENIGDLKRYMDNERYFRQVNLDDPMFKQREIAAILDGYNADDFGKYINYVTVRLRKHHENGQYTQDELRIDRNNFNQEGNFFSLMYGWKGDNDRRRWRDYEVDAQWSFFGGHTVEVSPYTSSYNAINLSPPYQRKVVDLEADPEVVKRRRILAITVSFIYQLGDKEHRRQVSMNAHRGELSAQAEFLLPEGVEAYEYEITWRHAGGRASHSGRQKTSESILFVSDSPRI